MIVNEIKDIIESIRALTGCRLIYRPVSDRVKLDFEHALHLAPLCSRLKKEMQVKCNVDCIRKVDARLSRIPASFLKKCHAGVFELVVPVISPSGIQGIFYLGPSRPAYGRKYTGMGKEYSSMPVYDKITYMNTKKILSVFTRRMAGEMEKPADEELKNSPEYGSIEKAVAFIKDNVNSKILAYKLAKECGLSLWYFLHLFKQKTGMSVTDYVRRVKMERAKYLLSTTDMKVTAIVSETGFNNENNFFITFRKYAGMTPGEYRKAIRRKAGI